MPADVMEAPVFDRQPPFSMEAELAVLGGMLIDPEGLVTGVEQLEAGMFYREAHRRIFRSMQRLFEMGATLDAITLAESLKSSGELEASGGWDYIGGLIDAVPTAANLQYHAGIVRGKAQLRRLIEVSSQTIRDVYEPGERTTSELVAAAETRVLGLAERTASSYVLAKHQLWDVFAEIEKRQGLNGQLPGISTGLIDLDRKLLGLHRGQLTVVAGRPSAGKSSLAFGFAVHASLGEQVPTLVFSFEMTSTELLTRALAMEARVDLQALMGGRGLAQDEHERMAAAAGHLNVAPLYIDDGDDSSISSVMARTRRAKKAENIGLVVIDYLQLMEGEGDERRLQIDHITRNCKRMARSLNVAVVLLSQLSRGPEGRTDKRPMLSDLRDSGSIEQDADNVIMVYRPDYYMNAEQLAAAGDKVGLTELIVPKQRNGPTGMVRSYFRKPCVRFENITRDGE